MAWSTASSLLTRAVLATVAELGGERARRSLLEGLDDPGRLEAPDERVDVHALFTLLERARAYAPGVAIGLRMAGTTARGRFRGVEYLVRSCNDLESGLAALVRFQALLFGAALVSRHPSEGGLRYRFEGLGSGPRDVLEDLALGLLVSLGRKASGYEWSPSLVESTHPERELAEHAEFYGCAVRSSCATGLVEVEAAVLERPNRERDAELEGSLRRFLERSLEELPTAREWTSRVWTAVSSQLRGGTPSLQSTARRLGVSERTLQTRLTEEDTTYSGIVDDVRFALARRLIAADEVTLPAVAQIVGFADPSAFHRAFKRWTSATPAAYRRSLQGATPR